MNLNNFTIKAQEAVQQAVQLATQNGQQAIEAVHLLKGVIMTGESVTNFIFQKLGVNIQNLNRVLDAQISSLPKVSGGEPYLSSEANAVCRKQSTIHPKWETSTFLWSRSFWPCSRKRAQLPRF